MWYWESSNFLASPGRIRTIEHDWCGDGRILYSIIFLYFEVLRVIHEYSIKKEKGHTCYFYCCLSFSGDNLVEKFLLKDLTCKEKGIVD